MQSFYNRLGTFKHSLRMWNGGKNIAHIENISTSSSSDSLNVKRNLTSKQRQRMEENRRIALAKQQFFQNQRSLQEVALQGSYQRNYEESENSFGNDCRQRMQTSSSLPSEAPCSSGISLSRQQVEVLRAVADGQSVFITGSAGTGKSFLLRYAIKVLKMIHQPKDVFVTASTGIAACALDGQTLHSFAGVGLGTGDREFLLSKVAKSKLASKRWKKVKALVIDEVSMIDGQLFDNLEYIAREMRNRGGKFDDPVWGGIQLIVTGDFFQLPPIKVPNLQKEFAFEADCWNASFNLQVELTHVFRQSEPQLIELLQSIRRGCKNFDHLQLLSSCSSSAPELATEETPYITNLYPRNADVRKVNNQMLTNLGEEIVIYKALDKGSYPWKSQLKDGIAPEELELCLGARVMLVKNLDHESGLVNGATGLVIGFEQKKEAESRRVVFDICERGLLPKVKFDSGLVMVVAPESWDVLEGDTVQATRRQIPLILAWALSVHKCQGMTLTYLHTDLSKAFGYGMIYVALSRVKSLDGLHLSGFNPSKIKAHPKVMEYYERLMDCKS